MRTFKKIDPPISENEYKKQYEFVAPQYQTPYSEYILDILQEAYWEWRYWLNECNKVDSFADAALSNASNNYYKAEKQLQCLGAKIFGEPPRILDSEETDSNSERYSPKTFWEYEKKT